MAGYCAYHLRRHGCSLVVTSVGLLMLFNAVYDTAATLKVAGTRLLIKLWWYKEALERENERLDRFV